MLVAGDEQQSVLTATENGYGKRTVAYEIRTTGRGGKGIVTIPYLINTPDGTEIRILGNGDSPWHVEGNLEQGYLLIDDRSGCTVPIEFEPLRPWLTQKTLKPGPSTTLPTTMTGTGTWSAGCAKPRFRWRASSQR